MEQSQPPKLPSLPPLPPPLPPEPAAHPAPTSSGGLFKHRPSFFSGRSSRAGKHQPGQPGQPPARPQTPQTPAISSTFAAAYAYSHTVPAPQSPSALAPALAPAPAPAPAPPPSTPPRRKNSARHSISSSVAELSTSLRRSRSASLRTNTSSGTHSSHKRTPSATLALPSFSPEKPPAASASAGATNVAPPAPALRPALSVSTFSRTKQRSAENVKPGDALKYEKSPLSAVDGPKTPFGMAPVPLRYPPTQKETHPAQRQQGSYSGLAPSAPLAGTGGLNPNITFQNIHELASKRISTLDYLRKAHEGRIYWFNTLLFAKTDLTRLPSFTSRNLARRATNYLLLGFSLPTVLDLNSNSPTDYLRTLNALLLEFETYQSIHPADGSTPSSLSRGRLPQMFKRSNIMGGKGRRSSSAAGDLPILTPQSSFSDTATSFDTPGTDDLLLPNESYTHLQTPSLPFDPDFFSTFATLCDVLIDVYTKILGMLSTPESVALAGGGVPSIVGDLFAKADSRVRKIILANVVREFEDSCRQGVRSEVGGVGKVVLGGLM